MNNNLTLWSITSIPQLTSISNHPNKFIQESYLLIRHIRRVSRVSSSPRSPIASTINFTWLNTRSTEALEVCTRTTNRAAVEMKASLWWLVFHHSQTRRAFSIGSSLHVCPAYFSGLDCCFFTSFSSYSSAPSRLSQRGCRWSSFASVAASCFVLFHLPLQKFVASEVKKGATKWVRRLFPIPDTWWCDKDVT